MTQPTSDPIELPRRTLDPREIPVVVTPEDRPLHAILRGLDMALVAARMLTAPMGTRVRYGAPRPPMPAEPPDLKAKARRRAQRRARKITRRHS